MARLQRTHAANRTHMRTPNAGIGGRDRLAPRTRCGTIGPNDRPRETAIGEDTRVSLLLRLRDRDDRSAWTEFDATYRPLVWRYARARGLDANTADDVTQLVMAAVVRGICSFDYDPSRGRFQGWLRTIANNLVRRMRRHAEPLPAGTRLAQPCARDVAPDAACEAALQRERLRAALARVRREVEDHTYLAFERYVLEEQPVERVCAGLQLTANQVYKAKWRILRMLQEQFGERGSCEVR